MDRDQVAHFQSLKATLGFVLTCAYEEKFGHRIRIESSFCDGWYARDERVEEVQQEDIDDLQVIMQSMVDKFKIEETTLPRSEVLSRLKTQKRHDKIPLFRIYRADPVPVIMMEKYWDTRLRPMETDRSILVGAFVLMKYQKGVLLRFLKGVPGEDSVVIPEFKDSPRFFTMLEDHQRWGNVLGIRNVSELNNRVYTGEVKELMLVAEGLHEKKVRLFFLLSNNMERHRGMLMSVCRTLYCKHVLTSMHYACMFMFVCVECLDC
jgi:uridine kinase